MRTHRENSVIITSSQQTSQTTLGERKEERKWNQANITKQHEKTERMNKNARDRRRVNVNIYNCCVEQLIGWLLLNHPARLWEMLWEQRFVQFGWSAQASAAHNFLIHIRTDCTFLQNPCYMLITQSSLTSKLHKDPLGQLWVWPRCRVGLLFEPISLKLQSFWHIQTTRSEPLNPLCMSPSVCWVMVIISLLCSLSDTSSGQERTYYASSGIRVRGDA